MPFDFLTLDDVDVSGKTVFLRVDINSPLDPVSKRILDDSRIKATLGTLRDLGDARVVMGAHQSRPGNLAEQSRHHCVRFSRCIWGIGSPSQGM